MYILNTIINGKYSIHETYYVSIDAVWPQQQRKIRKQKNMITKKRTWTTYRAHLHLVLMKHSQQRRTDVSPQFPMPLHSIAQPPSEYCWPGRFCQAYLRPWYERNKREFDVPTTVDDLHTNLYICLGYTYTYTHVILYTKYTIQSINSIVDMSCMCYHHIIIAYLILSSHLYQVASCTSGTILSSPFRTAATDRAAMLVQFTYLSNK